MKLKEWYDYKLDETQQKLLDETIDVYDLNQYIKNETEDLEESFWYKKIAVFVGQHGSGCFVDYEAVGRFFKSTTEELEFETNDYDPENENVIYIRPTGSFKCKMVDIINDAPHQEMKGSEFFTKATYNDRCYDNYCQLVEYLDRIGYFNHRVDAGLEPDASLANDANVDGLLEGNLAVWVGPHDEFTDYHMEELPIDPDLPLEDFLKLLEDNDYEVYDNMTEAEFYEDPMDPDLDNTVKRCYLYNPSMARNWCFSSKEAMHRWFTKGQNTNHFKNCCTSKPLDEGFSLKEGRYAELSKRLAKVEEEIKELRRAIKETEDEEKLDELFDELGWKEIEKGDLEGALAEIRYIDNGNANDYSGYESLQEDVKRRVVVQPHSGLSADGFNVYIYEGDKLISKTDYRYGYNASYSKEHADRAHKLVQDNAKYGWNNSYYTEKPYVVDILEKVAKENGLSLSELEFIDGVHVFDGSVYPADKFKSEYLNETKEDKIVIRPNSKKVHVDIEDKSKVGEEGHPIQKGLGGLGNIKINEDIEQLSLEIARLKPEELKELSTHNGRMTKYELECLAELANLKEFDAGNILNILSKYRGGIGEDLKDAIKALLPKEYIEEDLEQKTDKNGVKYIEFSSEQEAKKYFDENTDKLPDGAVMYGNKIYFGKDDLSEDIARYASGKPEDLADDDFEKRSQELDKVYNISRSERRKILDSIDWNNWDAEVASCKGDNEELTKVVNKYISLYKQEMSKLKQESLGENIEKHDTLNPVLFDNEELKPEVKEAIQKIVTTFIEELAEDEISVLLKDIILLGSNVSYNYTKDSDLDVHLIVDSSQLQCPPKLQDKLYGAYRSIFNKNYDINVKGIPVEIFVELDEPRAKSNGIYSLNTGWVKKPEQTAIPDLDKEAFDKLFGEWEERYNKLIGE